MPIASRFVIVFVVDGLRPDSITREDTPTLHRLRTEGVSFANSHAVFPTVTRVNAATLATGRAARHERDRRQPDVRPGRRPPARLRAPTTIAACARSTAPPAVALVLVPTLAERLHARGLRLAGVGSGSTGSTFLLNPRAPDGVGVLVNGYFEPGKTVAYPADVSAAILARFGPAPPKGAGRPLRRRGHAGRSECCASTCCRSFGRTW